MLNASVNTVPASTWQVAVGVPLLSQAPVVPVALIEKSSDASNAAFALSVDRESADKMKVAARAATRSAMPVMRANVLRSSFTLGLLFRIDEAGQMPSLVTPRFELAPSLTVSSVSSRAIANPSLGFLGALQGHYGCLAAIPGHLCGGML
jgi:hypothetical protein